MHRTATSCSRGCADAPARAPEDGVLFVHAGVLPHGTVDKTLALSDEVERRLAADDHEDFLREMYGNEPSALERRHSRATTACAASSTR